MIVIVCLDMDCGMGFGNRRQSRDRAVTERIMEICKGKKLWMDSYSAGIYGELCGVEIRVCEKFLENAKAGEFCLVERQSLNEFFGRIEGILAFWWNRKYPADLFLDLDLEKWDKVRTKEFSGSSHEKITEEFLIRKGVTE